MGIKIREKLLKSKEKSLYLDIIFKKQRKLEFLNLRITPEKSIEAREFNKEQYKLAEIIKNKRWTEILTKRNGIDLNETQNIDFIGYTDGRRYAPGRKYYART